MKSLSVMVYSSVSTWETSMAARKKQFTLAAAAAAKLLQSCPTLCNPTDGSPPDSPIPGILQARTLEWVAISFPNAWKWKVKVKSLSHVQFSATPWTAAHQAPPSMGFSRQEYWSGVPLPSLNSSLAAANRIRQESCNLHQDIVHVHWCLHPAIMLPLPLDHILGANHIRKRIFQWLIFPEPVHN